MDIFVPLSQEQVTWPTLEILGSLHISGMVEARNFKYGMVKFM